MGQKQREKKNKKLSAKIEIHKAVRQKKAKKFEKYKRLGLKISIVLVGILVIGFGTWAIAKNTAWYQRKFGKLVQSQQEYGVIETDKGKIVFELFPKDAPKTVQNFEMLTDKNYYDNLTFHRVEPGFVIQGGDPNGDGTGGESAWGGTFADEINPKSLGLSQDQIKANEAQGYKYNYGLKSHKMVVGSVAMANSGPNTNGSQFFIVTDSDQSSLDGKYTVFGQVVEGMDVVKKIAKGDAMHKVYAIDKTEYDLSKIK